MAKRTDDMRLLELARDKGLITASQLEEVREEFARTERQGQSKSPARLAIEKGILSVEDTQDLETQEWIRRLPANLGGYKLIRLLGRGGMAAVFEAQDVSLGKTVAVKVLLPQFCSSDSYLARFHREARVAARLTHPNTVQVFRAGEQKGIHFLVMEYVEGETLSAAIRERGRFPEAEALDIMIQLVGAVEEAAEMGIVHRDIKPGNILFSKWAIPKLADFGIAKELSDIHDPSIQASLTMGVIGTPSYMSPEQARGARDLDFRCDVYSLGATSYHMVIGEMPFHANTPQEIMLQVISGIARAPRTSRPDLSEGTASVICKMMAKSKEDRYATFEALRTDLEAARSGGATSVSYEDAIEFLKPASRDEEEDLERADALSLKRVATVAVVVAGAGLILLWMLYSCK